MGMQIFRFIPRRADGLLEQDLHCSGLGLDSVLPCLVLNLDSWSWSHCWHTLVLVMTTPPASITDRGQLLGEHLPGYVVVFLLSLIKSIPDLVLRLNHFCLRFKHELCLHNGSRWWGLHGKGGNKSGSITARFEHKICCGFVVTNILFYCLARTRWPWHRGCDWNVNIIFHRGGRGGAFSLNLVNMC